MRSKVGNEGREMVAEMLDCVTPSFSTMSFCVSPFCANISFNIRSLVYLYIHLLQNHLLFIIDWDIFILINANNEDIFIFFLCSINI